MNFLIATNTNFMGPASVMVYSLFRSHRDVEIDLYLAYHDLREQDIERLQKISSYFKKKRLHLIDVGGGLRRKYHTRVGFRGKHIIAFWH